MEFSKQMLGPHGAFVRIHRAFDPNNVFTEGSIINANSELMLVKFLDPFCWDGYQVLRMKDIIRINYKNNSSPFIRKYLEAKRIIPPRGIKLDITSWESLSGALIDLNQVVGIEAEEDDYDSCWIGRIIGKTASKVVLREINTSGRNSRKSTWPYKKITRVSFGSKYYEALQFVNEMKD